MELMNKGIDIDARIEVMENAYKAGVWNHGLCMAGFPSETEEEVQATFSEIRKYRHLFNSCAVNVYFLSYNSPMYNEPEHYGIKSISHPNAFDSHCQFKMDGHSEKQYQEWVEQFRTEYMEENKDTLWAMEYNNFDHLHLYLKKYGCEKVRDYHKIHRRHF